MANKSLHELIEQVKQNSFSSSKGFDRRRFLQGAGKVAGVSLGLTIAQSIGLNAVEVSAAAPKFSSYPFTLGVASGDPLADSIVLWTRLAPDPVNGGKMPNQPVPVKWELAEDEEQSTDYADCSV